MVSGTNSIIYLLLLGTISSSWGYLKTKEGISDDLSKSSSWITLGTFNAKTFYIDLSQFLMYAMDTFDLCHRNGWRAALIETPEENAYVANLLATAVPDFQFFWIAGTDLYHEGNWTSFHTEAPLNYTNWRDDINNDRSNCIYFTVTGHWIQTSCSTDTNRPLCQQ